MYSKKYKNCIKIFNSLRKSFKKDSAVKLGQNYQEHSERIRNDRYLRSFFSNAEHLRLKYHNLHEIFLVLIFNWTFKEMVIILRLKIVYKFDIFGLVLVNEVNFDQYPDQGNPRA